MRFEYDITFTNVAAGEEIRWLPRRRASGLALPGNDCWIFDGRQVLWNHFTGEGGICQPERGTVAGVLLSSGLLLFGLFLRRVDP